MTTLSNILSGMSDLAEQREFFVAQHRKNFRWDRRKMIPWLDSGYARHAEGSRPNIIARMAPSLEVLIAKYLG